MAGGILGGGYARVLVTAIALTSIITIITAFADRLSQARNIAAFGLWLLAGAAFAHATEPGTGLLTAATGVASLLPAGTLAALSIRAASVGIRARHQSEQVVSVPL
jgi:hypothetical protein